MVKSCNLATMEAKESAGVTLQLHVGLQTRSSRRLHFDLNLSTTLITF